MLTSRLPGNFGPRARVAVGAITLRVVRSWLGVGDG